MKPIWFTEFGFPSVDGCSNQPNVFYDPSSCEEWANN
ncbi:MAG: glycoside hydrolase TIM-barrel-like domain-containing protein [Rickettsia endosymbiont of Labidopullus appendiculatus]|nr:glycoside hydrolase TIM-barrel-like domain-containing protein [Rickettsia endosymbiont of Labidopullus appendiculatus]